jgi:hypothetical protein
MTEFSRRHFFVSAAAVGGVGFLGTPPANAAFAPGENSVEVVYHGWGGSRPNLITHLSVLAATDADGRVRTFDRVWASYARLPYDDHLPTRDRHVRRAERCYLIGPQAYGTQKGAWKITAIVNLRGERRAADAELLRKAPRKAQPTPLGSPSRKRFIFRAVASVR